MPIDFRIRDYLYPRALLKLRRTLEKTQWMAPAELEAHQHALLLNVLLRARDHVPFYRELLADVREGDLVEQGAAALRSLPLISGDDLRQRPELLLADDADRFGPHWEQTSGSSGLPKRFALDRGADCLEFCYYWRHWSWAGYRIGDRFAELGSVHFMRRAGLADRLDHWQPALRRLTINSSRVRADRAEQIAATIRRRRPRFLKGMASALAHLAACLQAAGIDDLTFDGVFSGGDVLTPLRRRLLETVFHGPVMDSYGHMERTVAICQCTHGGYHVNADYGVLELVDQRRGADGTLLGRVVGTSLHNRAMPLIRYDVGDHVEILEHQEPCPCGRTLPLVGPIHGRSEDTIVTPDGRFLTALFVVFDLVPGISAAQVHQEGPDRVRFLVVPEPSFDDAALATLEELGTRTLGPEVSLSISLGEESDLVRDRSGKIRPVVGGLRPDE